MRPVLLMSQHKVHLIKRCIVTAPATHITAAPILLSAMMAGQKWRMSPRGFGTAYDHLEASSGSILKRHDRSGNGKYR